jgi:glycosyltransferase involved in cell wall biosynthesis
MKDTRFSVALCTYNGARFLGEQLATYVAQDRRPDELVVCDDGSTDETLAILQRFSATSPFEVRIEVNTEKLGVVGNFARAIGLCTGDYIALSDQDDVWMPQKLQRIGEVFDANPGVGMCFTDAVAIDAAGNSLGYTLWDAVRFTHGERKAARRGRLLDVLLRHYVVTGATLAFRAIYRDVILPIPPHSLHDAWIGLLIAAVTEGHAIDEPLIGYRQHENQTSGGERVLNLFAQTNRARGQTLDGLETNAARFASARQRLAESRYASAAGDTLRLFDQKLTHARARAQMRRTGTFRLPIVWRELLSGRYYRYSHAWKAPAADLFL